MYVWEGAQSFEFRELTQVYACPTSDDDYI